MRYKTGNGKEQLTFLPVCPDDYVHEAHICRVIKAFVDRLDMVKLGFTNAETKRTGNKAFDPRMMLELYIYGYLNRVRSSRKLEAETGRNLEVIWLMDGLTPDDKTICNFRTDNAAALKKVFKEFVLFCRELGLYGGKVVAVDGTKFRANNSRKNNYTATLVAKELARIDKHISEYMNALEAADREEADEAPSKEELEAALEKLKEKKEKFDELQDRIEKDGEISTVDTDARLMHSGGDARPLDVCHNVQTVTDGENHLIVDFEVTGNSNDSGNLYQMTASAKDLMGVEELSAVADRGYYQGEDIAKCEENGVKCYVAKPKAGGPKQEEGYGKEKFVYDKENDCYICPMQEKLSFARTTTLKDGLEYRVYENFHACHLCPNRGKCTKARNRKILRSPHQDTLDIVDARTKASKEFYNKRQEIVEHPFGTVKAVWGFKQCLCRGREKVTGEVALAYLAYDLRRIINIFAQKGENLIEALAQ